MVELGPFDVEKVEYSGEPVLFTFCGEKFEIATSTGGMPLLRFAAAAKSGAQDSDMESLAAMHDMIRDCLKPDEYREPTEDERSKGLVNPILVNSEWSRFQECASKNRAPTALLMQICTAIYQILSSFPTGTPSDSLNGQSTQNGGPTSESKQ